MSLKKIQDLLKANIKKCLIYETHAGEIKSHTDTGFGGKPFVPAGEKWPKCVCCSKNLSFIFQLNLHDDFYSFFYCWDCFPGGFLDEEPGQWKIFHAKKGEKFTQLQCPDGIENLTPCICDSREGTSLPDWDGLTDNFPEIAKLCEEEDEDNPWDVLIDAAIELHCDAEENMTQTGGYPFWLQGSASRKCPVCSKEMEVFCQIGSEDNAKLMWGDAGQMYLFRCPEHKTEFQIEMQCY